MNGRVHSTVMEKRSQWPSSLELSNKWEAAGSMATAIVSFGCNPVLEAMIRGKIRLHERNNDVTRNPLPPSSIFRSENQMVVSKAENTLLDSKKSEFPGYASKGALQGNAFPSS
ncbi:hypothetical protein K1719_029793 [Acacia pycnantha]|nr:hypothetical protein K1719_029793 [Acacia pycnantha]